MKRWLIVVVVCLSVVSPAGAGTAALDIPDLPPQSQDALDSAEQVRQMAAAFPQGAAAADQLLEAARIAGHEPSPVQPAEAVDFTTAMLALYDAAGVTPQAFTPPAPDVAAAVAPLVAAVARGAQMTQRALADITPAERRWAGKNLHAFEMPWTEGAQRLNDIAARVDMDLMSTAAATIGAAIDALPDGLTHTSTWIDPSGAVEIGSTGDDTYAADRVLVIDLGGNDFHAHSAGGIGPVVTNSLALPVSVTVDLGGDDVYYVTAPNQPQNTIVAQGVGIGGVGLMADRWGSDTYVATLAGIYDPSCVGDPVFGGYPGRYPQVVHAQGTGALGVGAILDASGSDSYIATSYTATHTGCHFVRTAVHGQAAGLQRGLGVLIDDLGNDYRTLSTYARGFSDRPSAQDFVAGTYGQGFGAGGAGVLIDKEGSDWNYGNATATWDFVNASKGAFATTFVQGATAGLLFDHSKVDRSGGTIAVQQPDGITLPCSSGGKQGPDGGGSSFERACQGAGVGVHIDVLGQDEFWASASTTHGDPNLCFVGSVALVGAQGSAAWGGLGVLANLDAAGSDRFTLTSSARGAPCYADRTRAVNIGQGFGGAVKYPIWDDPDSFYAGVDQLDVATPAGYGSVRAAAPAVGILVSAGAPCVADPSPRPAPPAVLVGCTPSFDGVTASPDHYESRSVAINTGGGAIAESWVQGSGGPPRADSGYAVVPGAPAAVPAVYVPLAQGIGILVDVGGDDTHSSAPLAGGPGNIARSVAQGASNGGTGVLVNLFGTDVYSSTPSGASATTHHQGDARAGFGEVITPLAVFVDLGGEDTYGPTITCQGNGATLSPMLWGDLGSCGANPPAFSIGLDIASGVGI